MFRFGFSDDSDQNDDNDDSAPRSKKLKKNAKQETIHPSSKECDMLHFKEITFNFNLLENVAVANYPITDGYALKCVDIEVLEKSLSSNNEDLSSNVIDAINQNSDLVPKVYEGGFKVWECSIDMIHYLLENNIAFNNKSVLDLGCGSGFLGLHALLNGATEVHFQDYNEEVLEKLTIPNINANLLENGFKYNGTNCEKIDGSNVSVRCFAGSWLSFSEEFSFKYDVIMSSETIYCKSYYKSLHKIFESFLQSNGICILSAKTYYFGVGGGTREFEKFLKDEDVFDYETFKVFTKGVQREIMTLKFKNSEQN